MPRSSFTSAILVVFLLLATATGAYGRTITTSYGEEYEVEIPEGMTAEDAFYEMAVLYKEERHDRIEKQNTIQSLTEELKSYRESADSSIRALTEELGVKNELVEVQNREIEDLRSRVRLDDPLFLNSIPRFSVYGFLTSPTEVGNCYGVGMSVAIGHVSAVVGFTTRMTDSDFLFGIGYTF